MSAHTRWFSKTEIGKVLTPSLLIIGVKQPFDFPFFCSLLLRLTYHIFSLIPQGQSHITVRKIYFFMKMWVLFCILSLRFYQVRAGLKVSPRVPHRLIVTTQDNAGKDKWCLCIYMYSIIVVLDVSMTSKLKINMFV